MLHHVEVRDLETELRHSAAFPIAEAIDIVVELAEALAKTHELGAINGRVCTSNILVQRGAFGSARLKPAAPGVSTRTNQSTRSHLYLSPEQIADTPDLLAATDIWSLAVVLYELIAGKPPFADAEAIKRGTFTPLRGVRGCPPQVDLAVMSCLQRSPFARTQSIASFALNIAPYGSSRSKSLVATLKAMEPPASDPTMYAASGERESEPTLQRADRTSDPTLDKGVPDVASTMPPRHAADEDGATVLVPSSDGRVHQSALDEELDTFVKPTVPAGFAPLGPPILPAATPGPAKVERREPAFNDKTQRISTAQLQELGKHVAAAREQQALKGNQPVAGMGPAVAPMLRPPSSPELGTPISNIRVRHGAGLAPTDLRPQLAAMEPEKKPSRWPMIVSVVSLTIFIACVVAAALILLTHHK